MIVVTIPMTGLQSSRKAGSRQAAQVPVAVRRRSGDHPMPARKIEFISESAEKALDEAAKRLEAANETLRSERRVTETLQFERGYN
jgi:hypothetical protein